MTTIKRHPIRTLPSWLYSYGTEWILLTKRRQEIWGTHDLDVIARYHALVFSVPEYGVSRGELAWCHTIQDEVNTALTQGLGESVLTLPGTVFEHAQAWGWPLAAGQRRSWAVWQMACPHPIQPGTMRDRYAGTITLPATATRAAVLTALADLPALEDMPLLYASKEQQRHVRVTMRCPASELRVTLQLPETDQREGRRHLALKRVPHAQIVGGRTVPCDGQLETRHPYHRCVCGAAAARAETFVGHFALAFHPDCARCLAEWRNGAWNALHARWEESEETVCPTALDQAQAKPKM